MFECYGRTETGLIRRQNEDGFLLNSQLIQSGMLHESKLPRTILVAVADGMGGPKAGERASRIALQACSGLSLPVDEEQARAAIESIQEKLLAYEGANPAYKGLGTTLTGFAVHEDTITGFHIGDSRLYRFRGGFLKQLTQDHTLVQTLLELQAIQKQEAVDHPVRHVLMRCLGGGNHQMAEPDIFKVHGSFQRGDQLLLCTDGISNALTSEELEAILIEQKDCASAVDRIIDTAMNRGGIDNMTAVLVTRHY